jgi:SAM-dependent methyltransferase
MHLLDVEAAGMSADLAQLRSLLTESEFRVATVCRRLGVESIYDFRSIREGRTQARELMDSLDLLIRVFMDVEVIDRKVAEGLLSQDRVRMLERVGLIQEHPEDARLCCARVLLYPTESMWIVSDLNVNPIGSGERSLPDDAVYPAITKNTRHFLSTLPDTPCDSFLELCAGTGIAALLAARYARRSWASDITERATHFARFNAALNGINNCTAVQGDLYQPFTGETFDRIVAHPPYMPSLEQKLIFRDGGQDGEQITRRILVGLPEHLRPGGRFYCTCMLTDRKGARAEQRIREMLGSRQGEFDVVLITLQTYQPTDYYVRLALDGRATLEEVAQRHEIFKQLEVENLVYGSMVIQRRSHDRQIFTARRQVGSAMGVAEVEWLLRWEAAAAQPGVLEHLIEEKPAAASGTRLRLAHSMQRGVWVPDECQLATAWPFAVEAKCPPWTASLLAHCDGSSSTRAQLAFLQDRGDLPPDAPASEFVKLIRALISGGFMEVSGFHLPRPEPRPS